MNPADREQVISYRLDGLLSSGTIILGIEDVKLGGSGQGVGVTQVILKGIPTDILFVDYLGGISTELGLSSRLEDRPIRERTSLSGLTYGLSPCSFIRDL